ncbi:MAG TPA: hypothetical protein VFJ58_17100 [Armatimonadota bacterium]|nr:hypothetical protein [Armatimonadota bacterium]
MRYTTRLWDLVMQNFSDEQVAELRWVAAEKRVACPRILEFDHGLGCPSLDCLTGKLKGSFAVSDRDIFRPLQYCAANIQALHCGGEALWVTRHTVQMSGLHLESLLKRIGGGMRLPLGAALRRQLAKQRIPGPLWQSISAFADVYNATKREVNHPADTHLFSGSDSILAYLVSRKLGRTLYGLARLKTDLGAPMPSGK